MKKVALILTVLVAIAGCDSNPVTGKQNPYDGKGELQDPGKPKDTPTKDEKPVGALSLYVDQQMLFVEGGAGEYGVKATVPVGGNLVVEVNGLPPGMVYDATTMKLKWTPDYQAANDPNNPNTNSRQYPIEVRAYDSKNPIEQKVQAALVVVNDTPRPAGLKSVPDKLGIEGSPMAHIIDFEDLEYPTGPFSVSVSGLPIDAVVDFPNNTMPRFILRWTPTFDKVINKMEEIYTGNVIIYNPRGKRLDFNVVWTIANRIAPPQVGGPTDVSESGTIHFMVMAEDQNGEYIPQWSGIHPGFGTLNVSTTPVTGGLGRPKSMGSVAWSGIPADKLNKTHILNLRACVQGSNCASHQVRVIPTASVLKKEVKQ